MKENPTFSIVIPIYNESESMAELYRRIVAVMDEVKETWEFVMVDDGSKDNSGEEIMMLAENDQRVRPVIFARNFGQQSAVAAGLDFARGAAVIVIDADLQDPPELIPQLIKKWREGYQVVYAKRLSRAGETFFKRITAKTFYRVINRITDIDIPLDTGFFRLIDRKVVSVLTSMKEHHRFFRAMSIWVGFKQIGVEYEREERFAGETNYRIKDMVKLAMNAITGFSFWPLQVALYLGFITAGVSIIGILFVIIARMTGNQAFLGQASTLIVVLFFGGVQLITLGILGEYIGRMYDDVRNRPMYITSYDPHDSDKEN
ncbi:MAG: glycosyltransferase family 2 protein [Chloroflexota bacterium]